MLPNLLTTSTKSVQKSTYRTLAEVRLIRYLFYRPKNLKIMDQDYRHYETKIISTFLKWINSKILKSRNLSTPVRRTMVFVVFSSPPRARQLATAWPLSARQLTFRFPACPCLTRPLFEPQTSDLRNSVLAAPCCYVQAISVVKHRDEGAPEQQEFYKFLTI